MLGGLWGNASVVDLLAGPDDDVAVDEALREGTSYVSCGVDETAGPEDEDAVAVAVSSCAVGSGVNRSTTASCRTCSTLNHVLQW